MAISLKKINTKALIHSNSFRLITRTLNNINVPIYIILRSLFFVHRLK